MIFAFQTPSAVVAPGNAPAVAAALRDRGAPGTDAALETVVRDLLAVAAAGQDAELDAALRRVFLPDPSGWYGRVFGADLGAKLTAAHARSLDTHCAELADWLKTQGASPCQVRIRRGEKAGRHGVEFTLLDVFQAMVEPVPLLEAYVFDAAAKRGRHWGPFALIDGEFRYLGRLDGLPPGDMDKLPPDPEGSDPATFPGGSFSGGFGNQPEEGAGS
jgi:hypothetical protein